MNTYLRVVVTALLVAQICAQDRYRPRRRTGNGNLYLEDTRGIQPRPEGRFIQDERPPPSQTLDRPDRRPRPRPVFEEEVRTKPPPVTILRQISEKKDDGSYVYGYEGSDGSFKIETRYPDGLVKGKYGYVDTAGKVRVIEYGADRHGFRPAGEGITVPPVVIPKDEPFMDYDYPIDEPQERPVQRRPVQTRPAQRRRRPQPKRRIAKQPQQSQARPKPISVESIVSGQGEAPRFSAPPYIPKSERRSQPETRPPSPSRSRPVQYPENEVIDETPPPPPKPFSFTQEVSFGAPHEQTYRHKFVPIERLRLAPRPAAAPQPAAPSRAAPQRQPANPSILDSLLAQFELPQQGASKNIHDITFGLI